MRQALQKNRERLSLPVYALCALVTLLTLILCVCAGSVSIPLARTCDVIGRALLGMPLPASADKAIILSVRLPRVLCVALSGTALSLCGAAMQGLLRNPLADGSTLGVSSGASLGAMLAILLGISVPSLPLAGTAVTAMLFAFLSLVLVLALAYALDKSLATNTIILIGVVFTMFMSSLMSLLITFSGEKLKSLTFWTLGSLAGANYASALLLLAALSVCGAVLLLCARELNAFAMGEENARHVGVNVRRVKLTVMIAVSALIGVCVSVGGTIGFVGLMIPHMTRMVTGPNHHRLLPASMFAGAVFLMLADLASRVLLSPLELPIGVVTSFVGAVVFVYIFYRSRKGR